MFRFSLFKSPFITIFLSLIRLLHYIFHPPTHVSIFCNFQIFRLSSPIKHKGPGVLQRKSFYGKMGPFLGCFIIGTLFEFHKKTRVIFQGATFFGFFSVKSNKIKMSIIKHLVCLIGFDTVWPQPAPAGFPHGW